MGNIRSTLSDSVAKQYILDLLNNYCTMIEGVDKIIKEMVLLLDDSEVQGNYVKKINVASANIVEIYNYLINRLDSVTIFFNTIYENFNNDIAATIKAANSTEYSALLKHYVKFGGNGVAVGGIIGGTRGAELAAIGTDFFNNTDKKEYSVAQIADGGYGKMENGQRINNVYNFFKWGENKGGNEYAKNLTGNYLIQEWKDQKNNTLNGVISVKNVDLTKIESELSSISEKTGVPVDVIKKYNFSLGIINTKENGSISFNDNNPFVKETILVPTYKDKSYDYKVSSRAIDFASENATQEDKEYFVSSINDKKTGLEGAEYKSKYPPTENKNSQISKNSTEATETIKADIRYVPGYGDIEFGEDEHGVAADGTEFMLDNGEVSQILRLQSGGEE